MPETGQDSADPVDIYTDGGCSGNPGPGGWAYIMLSRAKPAVPGPAEPGEVLAEEAGSEKHTTNNRMELIAVISALKKAQSLGKKSIRVFTDSQYVQKGITQWIQNWKHKAWKTSGGDPVKNQDLWQELDTLAAALLPTWKWVRGHAGNQYNERCDSMVGLAIENA
jgi:ribonuclease HI